MELIPQRLATANKLSSCKEEDKEDYMYIIYKDGEQEQKQRVKIIYEDANIFALGECVEHNGMCYGLVAPLYEMAEVIADNLTGTDYNSVLISF